MFLIGTNARHLYLVFTDSHAYELQAVAFPQINVPFGTRGCGISPGNGIHRETAFLKGLIHLIAYLKGIQGDTGTYHGFQIAGVTPVGGLHDLYGMLHYPGACASPTGMNGGNDLSHGVLQENGNAIGRGDTDTELLLLGDYGIDVLQQLGLLLCRCLQKGWVDIQHMGGVCLMGQDELGACYTKHPTESCTVLCYVCRIIATVMIGIKASVCTYTNASSTLGAEGGYML